MLDPQNYKTYIESNNAELETARMIQEGLLPKPRHFSTMFEESFVLDLPLNIISGDFYWVGLKNDLQYLVVGDCTGHGISAAMLSVLAINLFESAIMNKGIKKTYKILQEVDKKFIESFKKFSIGDFDNPWIDLSIVCIDQKKSKLYFSAANRKLLHVGVDKSVNVLKGNRYPIGGWQLEENRRFNPEIIDYKKGDVIYLGSDGFQDQIGGPNFKKYKSKELHNFLISNMDLSFSEQRLKLKEEFFNWKKDTFQVDDVCLVGVKL